GMSSDLAQQVQQLINQGYKISLEFADVRRYRSGAWQTAESVQGNRVNDVLAAVEARLREHSGNYVRLVGIDPQAKRRVLETTIQRP
ncbi:MAG TPA: ribulose bisphosphate carboxylase small subunit, partial [Leptolyngbyaceae cyanobacterium]